MKKVELLAPAGCFESFLGAIHAGADAVYIGGRKYGARAYAENFTEEEVCLAIRYAHLFGRKLYLTVNTLVKESEIGSLPEYIRPFYEEGLDGVIIQDMGVFALLRECFPGLELHGSTQMTVTGPRGARLLLEQGASRVVPARELSLHEITRIKETGIEVEAFVHGAMCYCYSGQCLFSSMLGGRSGNRGRCAQPCRLPYQIEGAASSYPLSLKDMCTITFLPELIRAGIDSFKIEGRMKKPEYAAGVTALYRKYIDRYYAAPEEPFAVSADDMEKLRSLYIRSEIQEGYYHKQNGREMITPDGPGYSGTDEAYLKQIREAYLENGPKLPVCGKIVLKKEAPAILSLRLEAGNGNGSGEDTVSRKGEVVQAARKQPLTKETVEKQLRKTGNTAFVLEKLAVDMDADTFLPVKALNDLRREALHELETVLAKRYRRDGLAGVRLPVKAAAETENRKTGITADRQENSIPRLSVQITQAQQLSAACAAWAVDRIYLDGDLLFSGFPAEQVHEGEPFCSQKEGLFSRLTMWKSEKQGRSLFLVMPCVIRERDEAYLKKVKGELFSAGCIWDGVMIRNLESLYFLQEAGYRGELMADANLYVWNRRARQFFEQMGVSVSAPLECNKGDWHTMGIQGMEVIVYGRNTLMVTANCIRKTGMQCLMEMQDAAAVRTLADKTVLLRDRYQTDFPVRTVCSHCYNEIYNSVPLSLHEYGKSIRKEMPSGVRLVFTIETQPEMRQVLACYEDFMSAPEKSRQAEFSFTKGHYKRGAE